MSERAALTILGSSSAAPRPGRACSGYLLEAGDSAIVLDLGSGSCANLLRARAPESVDAFVISHAHADHFLDLVTLRYALKYGRREHARRPIVYISPESERTLRALTSSFARESDADFLDEMVETRPYDHRSLLQVGAWTLRFAPGRHFIETFAVRCESNGVAIVYSADTAPTEALVELASGCDLLLCEATLLPDEAPLEHPGHLRAREAGEMAHAAGARALAITHYPAGQDVRDIVSEAAAAYSGTIHVVDDGDRYDW